MKSTTTGRAQMNEFIQKRLNSNDISFWEPIPSLKIKTVDLSVKQVAVKATDEKKGEM